MLRDELAQFSSAIRGERVLPSATAVCPRYPVTSALGIYGNNYRGNLHNALTGAYPVIVQIVGADFFRRLAHKFIEHHPSRSGNLHDYGAEMPDFLSTFAPAQGLPYLADVATLEWACHLAYYAPDVAAFDLTRLQQIPAAQYASLVWRCHPSISVLNSSYPLVKIWHVHQPGSSDEFHIDLDSGGGMVLVSRSGVTVDVNPLPAAEEEWLQHIQAGAALGVATDAALAAYPDFDLAATLSRFVTQGVLIDFVLK